MFGNLSELFMTFAKDLRVMPGLWGQITLFAAAGAALGVGAIFLGLGFQGFRFLWFRVWGDKAPDLPQPAQLWEWARALVYKKLPHDITSANLAGDISAPSDENRLPKAFAFFSRSGLYRMVAGPSGVRNSYSTLHRKDK